MEIITIPCDDWAMILKILQIFVYTHKYSRNVYFICKYLVCYLQFVIMIEAKKMYFKKF